MRCRGVGWGWGLETGPENATQGGDGDWGRVICQLSVTYPITGWLFVFHCAYSRRVVRMDLTWVVRRRRRQDAVTWLNVRLCVYRRSTIDLSVLPHTFCNKNLIRFQKFIVEMNSQFGAVVMVRQKCIYIQRFFYKYDVNLLFMINQFKFRYNKILYTIHYNFILYYNIILYHYIIMIKSNNLCRWLSLHFPIHIKQRPVDKEN